MRTLSPVSFIRQLCIVTLLFAAVMLLSHVAPHAHVATAAAPLLLGPLKGFGKSYDLLASLVKPLDASQPESIPWVFYDTQPYAAAGQALPLTFFGNATAANAGDPTLSNFATGQLETGYYFEIHRVHTIIDAIPANVASNAVTGPMNDVEIIHKTARANLTFSLKGKSYGPTKLAYFGRPGGPMPFFSIFAAAASMTSVGETESNGGFPLLGNIIIPPTTQFKAVMAFQPTLVPISALTNITVAMLGVLHRPVA